MALDLAGATFDKPDLTGARFDPPVQPRGALGEVGTGLARGALVGLPSLAGQALQYTSSPGQGVYEFGRGLVQSAEARGQSAGLTLQPEQHGVVTNALASGAEMLPSGLAVPLAIGGAAAAAGASPLVAGGAAIAGAGALFGAQTGQATLEKAEKAGVAPDVAQHAARLNAAQTFAAQTALGAVGGKLLGVFGTSMGKIVGSEAGPLAADTLKALTGQQGMVSSLARQLPASIAEAVGVNAAQAGASAAIEQNYGIDTTSPTEAALGSVAPTLGMTALLSPLGLVARGAQVRSAQARTAALAHPETDPAMRGQLADEYAAQLAKVDPAAAANFRANAEIAIQHKQILGVDSSLFDAGAVQPPVSSEPTTSPGAAPEAPPAQPPSVEAPLTPNWDTTPGAAPPREGVPFVRDVDTSGIEIAQLHAQVKQALIDGGEQPADALTSKEFSKTDAGKGLKGQKLVQAYQAYLAAPETAEGLMRRDADAYEAMQTRQRAEDEAANAPRNAPPQDTGPAPDLTAGRVSLADAMTDAIKARDEAQATAEREARKSAETDAIANVTKGDELAAAAERGEVQADPNAPKSAADITADWKSAMEANELDTKAQARVPFEKRITALGIDKMATHQEQIDALSALAADKKVSQSMRDRAQMVVDRWRAELPAAPVDEPASVLAGIPPPQSAALGENIAPKGLTEAQPAAARAATAGLEPNNLPIAAAANRTADKIAELRAGFAQRLRDGEKLSPLEQERYEDLAGAAQSIDRFTEGKAAPGDANYVAAIVQMVDGAREPYAKSRRGTPPDTLPRLGDPDHVDPVLLAPAAFSHKAADVLAHLAQHGSQPWVKVLAAKLHPLLPETKLATGGEAPATKTGFGRTLAEYEPKNDTISIYDGGASESTFLHEAVHGATVQRIAQALAIGVPHTQEEARLRTAVGELQKVAAEAARLPGADKAYGMTSPYEFVAEVHSNPAFRDFLRSTPTLWGRVVDAVRRLLGLGPKGGDLVERALNASEPFFSENRIQSDFAGAPDSAAHALEGSLQKAILSADDSARTPLDKIATAGLRALLPLRTVDNIAHGVRGSPEMVKYGFSAGADAQQRANTSHNVADTFLKTPINQYVGRLTRVLNAMGDVGKSVATQAEMMTIGGEASRVGFDYRKSGKDNLAANKELDPKDKAYMDEIHRRFKQLQAAQPDAAKALEEGERLNRGALVAKTATLVANLMDARAGIARRLAADIQRLSPEDAQRAVLENQLKVANLESLLADKHSAGLDFQDPTLKGTKNAFPTKYNDSVSAGLAARLQGAFTDAAKLPEGTPIKTHLQALAGFYYAQERNPYFSLGRDGDYFVKARFNGIDAAANSRIQAALSGTNKVVGDLTRGDDHAYFRVGTADEAKALHDKLVLAGQGKVTDTAWGLQAEKIGDVAGVNPALRSLLNGIDDMVSNNPALDGEQGAIMKASIVRQVLSMLPETAARSASIGRRGVPGYGADFLTSYARRAEGSVHDTAGLYTTRQYAEAARMRTEAIKQLNASGSTEGRLRAQQVDDELNLRYAQSMKPAGNPVIGQATSLSHSFYLGLSPAFFIRTTAQPFHRGLPIVGSKFGFVNGAHEIFSATPTAIKAVWQSVQAAAARDGMRGVIGAPIDLKGLDLTPKEQGFVQELHDRGLLDLGESSQLQRAAKGSQKLQDVLKLVSVSAQMAEMTNRLAMGLAAFRLAEKQPGKLGKETSSEYAIKAINLAMDNFDPANTARAIGRHGFAGPLTPLFTQFQNYSLQTMQQIFRTAHDGFFGQDKSPEGLQRAAEAKKEFAGLMATTAMVSGALGLPFANAFAGVYNTLMSDPDDPKDVRISVRNWAADVFGKDVGTALMRGPAAALGVDTSSFGLEGLLPGSDFLASRLLWKDRADESARSMLGPAVSLGLDLFNAGQKLSDGYYVKAIEAALPVGLRTYFKTAEMAGIVGPGGYTDSKGNPLPLKAGGADLAWRALGFQTTAKAEQGEAARDLYTNQELLKHRRGVITDQYVKGVSDPAALAEAGQALGRYNSANPLQPITGPEITGAIRAHMVGLALGEASGTGVPVSKSQFRVLPQSERFAAMPGR